MQLVEIGLDHGTAEVAIRERLAVSAADLPELLAALYEIAAEAVVLSTCNRVELYLHVEDEAAAIQRVSAMLARGSGLTIEQIESATCVRIGQEAVRHLCRVATGLESMIVGEPEIAGQVRAALTAAEAAGTASVVLRRLFDDALGVAGRLRAESGIGRHAVSVSTAAVRLGERTLGGLEGKTALVIGAGSVGRSAARVLATSGVERLMVASRRLESARPVAEKVGAEAVNFEGVPAALAAADLVLSATSAPHLTLTADAVHAALVGRPDRQLIVLDVAVPRDVEPSVREIEGCTLFDVDDLAAAREASLAARRVEATKAEAQIERAVDKFVRWWHGRSVANVVADLVAHAERVRQSEVARGLARLGETTDREREIVEATTAAIVRKLLHQPIVALKRRGADPETGVYLEAIGELFALPSAPPAVRRPLSEPSAT